MKNNKIKQIASWIISFIPMFLVIVFYSKLPELIPTNWNFGGQITYGSKLTIWIFAGLAPLLNLLRKIIPYIDPRRQNYKKFEDQYYLFGIVLSIFLIIMTGIVISESIMPGRISVSTFVCASLGVLFIVIGNMMPKFKSNFYVGIKTPWTLSNTIVWNRVHRISGYLWIVGGILVILLTFMVTEQALFYCFFSILSVMVLIPVVLSFYWYRREKKQTGSVDDLP